MDEDEAPVWSGARRVSLNEREAKQLSHTTVKSMKEEEEEVKPHPDGPAGPIAVERAQKLRLLAEGNVHQGAFSCALNPGGSLAAVGCLDGKFRIHKRRAGSWAYVLDLRQRGLSSTSEHVATGASWRPKQDQHTQNVVLVGSTSGALAHWHPSTNSLLGTTIYENNKIYTLAYRSDAASFASAGRDTCVRLYDAETRQCTVEMQGGDGKSCGGHTNSIYALRYMKAREDMLISAGFDSTIQIWDSRVGHSVRSIGGPMVNTSDGLDIKENTIITASRKDKNPLQIWDLQSGSLVKTIAHGPAQGGPHQVAPTSVKLLDAELDGYAMIGCGPEMRLIHVRTDAVKARLKLKGGNVRALDYHRPQSLGCVATSTSFTCFEIPDPGMLSGRPTGT